MGGQEAMSFKVYQPLWSSRCRIIKADGNPIGYLNILMELEVLLRGDVVTMTPIFDMSVAESVSNPTTLDYLRDALTKDGFTQGPCRWVALNPWGTHGTISRCAEVVIGRIGLRHDPSNLSVTLIRRIDIERFFQRAPHLLTLAGNLSEMALVGHSTSKQHELPVSMLWSAMGTRVLRDLATWKTSNRAEHDELLSVLARGVKVVGSWDGGVR